MYLSTTHQEGHLKHDLLKCHMLFPKPALTDFFLFLLLLFALCSKAASLSSLALSLPALTATPMAWGFWPDRAMSHSTDSNPLITFIFSRADRSAKKDPQLMILSRLSASSSNPASGEIRYSRTVTLL